MTGMPSTRGLRGRSRESSDAARGLERLVDSGGEVTLEGGHRYRLVGMNTVLLRPRGGQSAGS
jgi:hypothetical protein